MLRSIQKNGSLQLKGTVAFYRAQSVGDDIEILDEDGVVLDILHGLRQQVMRRVILQEARIIFVLDWAKNIFCTTG